MNWLVFSLFLFTSVQSYANPLGMIFGRGDQRGHLEGQFQSDAYQLSEKKESGEKRFQNYSGKMSLNFYKGEETTWFVTANREKIETGAQEEIDVGPNNTLVGSRLESMTVGLGFRQAYIDDSVLVLAIDYGSASDDPFENARDTTIGANFAYAFSPDMDSQWIFFVNYSNNRTFLKNIPIPAFAYVYRPSRVFSLTLGIPFLFLNYMDYPTSTFRLFLSPSSAGFDWALGVLGPLQVYSNFTFKARSYMHVHRQDDSDRLILEEKTASIGLRSPLTRWLSLEASSGLSFDRIYYEGEGLFRHEGKKENLKEDLFILGKVTIRI